MSDRAGKTKVREFVFASHDDLLSRRSRFEISIQLEVTFHNERFEAEISINCACNDEGVLVDLVIILRNASLACESIDLSRSHSGSDWMHPTQQGHHYLLNPQKMKIPNHYFDKSPNPHRKSIFQPHTFHSGQYPLLGRSVAAAEVAFKWVWFPLNAATGRPKAINLS